MDLFAFQNVGAEWLSDRKHALLADEMGLGKSAQVIAAADNLMLKKILVLCPAIARLNWDREFRKFSLFTRKIHVASDSSEALPTNQSIITSYDLAVRFAAKGWWHEKRFDLVVLDEAHFLKSLEAKRTREILGTKGASIGRLADRLWCVTGTPMPNHPGELWVMLKTFGRTKLSYYSFLHRYCLFKDDKFSVLGANPKMIPELKELLRPIMLRRMADEVLKELPPISYNAYPIERGPWTPTDEDLEKCKASIAQLHGLVLTPQLLEALSPSLATLRRITGMQKIGPTTQIVSSELENGLYQKIVIFGIHRDVIAGIAKSLAKYNPAVITGDTSPLKRQEEMDRFQNDPNCHVFAGNIIAAGTSITLTASNQVLFVEQDFVPGNNAQAALRCRRIGQTRPVFVRYLEIADSIDSAIARVVARKTQDIIKCLHVDTLSA